MLVATTETFLEQILPDLLLARPLDAVFITYNEVVSFDPGEIPTRSPDVGVHLYTRASSHSDLVSTLEARLGKTRLLAPERSRVFFLYMGMNHIDQVCKTVQAIEAGFAEVGYRLVLVTCRCDKDNKLKRFEEQLREEVSSVIICEDCGGGIAFRDLISTIIHETRPAAV